MKNTGKTPLFRARKVEEFFGVKEVYLKLEGANPYGHKYDRIADLLVRDAKLKGHDTILVDGPMSYIESFMGRLAGDELKLKVPCFTKETRKKRKLPSEILLPLHQEIITDKSSFFHELCQQKGFFNAVNGYHNRQLSMLALEEIGEEVLEKFSNGVDMIFTQLSYGYTASSLYSSFYRKWSRGDIEQYPKIISATIPHGNKIFDHYMEQKDFEMPGDIEIKPSRYTRDLFINDTDLLQEALQAVRDTGGEILSVDEDLLKESANFLRRKEHISLSTEEAYPFAAFYKMAKDGQLKDGKYVIVLNNGKSDLDIIRINDFKTYDRDFIVDTVDSFLQQYSDPRIEIEDAVQNAADEGFILLALRGGVVQGITVVVSTGFDHFIPKYHLGYIGTQEGNKGRGIASQLMEEAIEQAGESISLHVEPANKRAMKLYQKMGFSHEYSRMIFSSWKKDK